MYRAYDYSSAEAVGGIVVTEEEFARLAK